MLVAGVRTKEDPAVAALTTATIEIERERLQFEREKWQAEITVRQLEREEELSRRAWVRQRDNEEREERRQFGEARFKQEEVRIALMIEANKLQSVSVGKENTKVESVTFKLKQYGDVLRHSLFKMADNPLELVSFFVSVDKLFLELKVPSELQVNLLKPYLSEKALNLLNRLTGTDASDFKVVKQYLMDQFRMCPQFFLEKFNRVQR